MRVLGRGVVRVRCSTCWKRRRARPVRGCSRASGTPCSTLRRRGWRSPGADRSRAGGSPVRTYPRTNLSLREHRLGRGQRDRLLVPWPGGATTMPTPTEPRANRVTDGPVSTFLPHHFRHLNAATLIDASDAYTRHLERGGYMMITLAGAMSTGELGLSLAEMIRQDKVQIITCTGANLEEDVFNLIAHDFYERVPHYRDLTPEDER